MFANYSTNPSVIHSFAVWLLILQVFSLVQHLGILVFSKYSGDFELKAGKA